MTEHRPRKRFAQHFLHDAGVIERILRSMAPGSTDHVVEIGPGLGALTEPLLDRCARLDVIEIDRDLSARLAEKLGHRQELHIHCADALKVDLMDFVRPGERLRVVGNLPYNLSTPLLFHLLERPSVVADMHLMLQREVVDRLIASPGGGDYGRLTVMVRVWCTCEKLFNVASGAFRPPPRVTSAVARLRVRDVPAVDLAHPPTFERLVARLFSRRRKTLRNGLRGLLDEAAVQALGIDPGARPETLELEQFAALANALDPVRHGL